MKKHHVVLAGLALFASAWSSGVRAEALAEASNLDMVKVLNDMTVIAEQEPSAKMPFAIRSIRVQSDGECDGAPRTCPVQNVYIAVSELGEHPERKLYQLPAAHGWTFKDWIELPAKDTPDQYYVLTMERRVPTADASWWSTEVYRIRVNYHDAGLERISP
jgi:hypothetical protein